MVTKLPLPKRGTAPHFRLMSVVAKTAGWIKMPLGTEVDPGPRHIVLDGDPVPPPKGAQQPPSFRPISIVAKRSPISATAEHFLSHISKYAECDAVAAAGCPCPFVCFMLVFRY